MAHMHFMHRWSTLASNVGTGKFDQNNSALLGARLYQFGAQLELNHDQAGATKFYTSSVHWLAQASATSYEAMLNAGFANANVGHFPQAIASFRAAIEALWPTLMPYTEDKGYTQSSTGLQVQETFVKAANSMGLTASKVGATADLRWLAAQMETACAASDLSGTEVNLRGGEQRYWTRARCYWGAGTLRGRSLALESSWAAALEEYEVAALRMKDASERFQRHRFKEPAGYADKVIAEYAANNKFFALGYTAFWSEVLSVKLFRQVVHQVDTDKTGNLRDASAALDTPSNAAPHFFSYGHSGTASAGLFAVGFSHRLITTAQRKQLALLEGSTNPNKKGIGHMSSAQLIAMSVREFQSRYMLQNRPVVVEDPALSQWKAADVWTDLDALTKRHGKLQFGVSTLPYRGGNSIPTGTHQLTLAQFIQQVIRQGSDDGGATDRRFVSAVLGRYHPMAADIGPLEYFTPGPELYMSAPRGQGGIELFFGPALSGLHPREHTAAWDALLAGKRWWFMWPRFCRGWDARGDHSSITVWQWVLNFLPQLRSAANANRNCAPIEFIQSPGQVVYVPSGWGHAVLNIEPSISVSQQIGDLDPLHLGSSFLNSTEFF